MASPSLNNESKNNQISIFLPSFSSTVGLFVGNYLHSSLGAQFGVQHGQAGGPGDTPIKSRNCQLLTIWLVCVLICPFYKMHLWPPTHAPPPPHCMKRAHSVCYGFGMALQAPFWQLKRCVLRSVPKKKSQQQIRIPEELDSSIYYQFWGHQVHTLQALENTNIRNHRWVSVSLPATASPGGLHAWTHPPPWNRPPRTWDGTCQKSGPCT